MPKPTLRPVKSKQASTVPSATNVASAIMAPELLALGPVAELVETLITSFKDYLIADSKERTERERITSELQKHIVSVNADTTRFRAALDKNHEIRSKVFDTATDSLRHAVSVRDHQLVEAMTKFMLDIYQSDPANGYRSG